MVFRKPLALKSVKNAPMLRSTYCNLAAAPRKNRPIIAKPDCRNIKNQKVGVIYVLKEKKNNNPLYSRLFLILFTFAKKLSQTVTKHCHLCRYVTWLDYPMAVLPNSKGHYRGLKGPPPMGLAPSKDPKIFQDMN